MSVRVLIADDQQLVRTGFRLILESNPDIEIVGEAANGREAVALADEHRPDVVLMDIRMPELDGIEATRQLTAGRREPPTRVLILTTFDLDEYVFDALLAPTITRRLIEEFTSSRPGEAPPGLGELIRRELEILGLVGKGMSNAEIAAQLVIGETTVKTHVARVQMKLGLRDRIQAVVLAYEAGIVTPNRRRRPA